MMTAESIGNAVLEKDRLDIDLAQLRIKAVQYGEKFSSLANLLKNDPTLALFEDQSTTRGLQDIVSFRSRDFDGIEIKDLVDQIRQKEERLYALSVILSSR